MENVNIIVELIRQLGFPIGVSILCFWYIKHREEVNDVRISTIITNFDEEQTETRQIHHDEIAKLTEAINNNTLIITKLYEKMENNNVK